MTPERRHDGAGRRSDDGMTDEQFGRFVRSMKAAFAAAVSDAIETGHLPDPQRVTDLEEAIYGHEDPATHRRTGGLRGDMRSLDRKQNVSLSLQTILLLAIPVIVALISSQP